jgi:hypothetical protein
MAVALDGSSPVRFAGVIVVAGGAITSASFTAPTDAYLTICVQYDGGNSANVGTVTASDSGGLTWTKQVEHEADEATLGGGSAIFTARTTSSVSRTVSINRTGGASGDLQFSAKCYVWTGVDVNGTPIDSITANNEGGSLTNNINTTSLTPGATGVLLVSDTDWAASGVFEASSDLTQDTATYGSAISACSGYKTCTSGVGVTGNLNAAGSAAAQHKWTQIIIRQAVGASAALTGTATASITEADIVAGGKTIIITLTGDTFIPS